MTARRMWRQFVGLVGGNVQTQAEQVAQATKQAADEKWYRDHRINWSAAPEPSQRTVNDSFWHDKRHDSGEVQAIRAEADLAHFDAMSRTEFAAMNQSDFDAMLANFGPPSGEVPEVDGPPPTMVMEAVSTSDDTPPWGMTRLGVMPIEPVEEIEPASHVYLIEIPVESPVFEPPMGPWLEPDEMVIGWLIQDGEGGRRLYVPLGEEEIVIEEDDNIEPSSEVRTGEASSP